MNCVYAQCKARGSCREDYCVGRELAKQGMTIRFGQIVRAEKEEAK